MQAEGGRGGTDILHHFLGVVMSDGIFGGTRPVSEEYVTFRKALVDYVSKVNRVEVIDYTKTAEDGGGRAYTFWQDDVSVNLVLQDDERTLKVFISKK